MSDWERQIHGVDGAITWEPLTGKVLKTVKARFKEYMDDDPDARPRDHLKLGRSRDGTRVTPLGDTRQMHGPNGVCTCCHGRTP